MLATKRIRNYELGIRNQAQTGDSPSSFVIPIAFVTEPERQFDRLKEVIKSFGGYLSDMVAAIFSYHDTSGSEPERVYHAFVLGLFANLGSQYHVRTNRESGYGRYDVMLIPNDPQKPDLSLNSKK